MCLILLKDFMEVHVCEIPIHLSSIIYLAIYLYPLFIFLYTDLIFGLPKLVIGYLYNTFMGMVGNTCV